MSFEDFLAPNVCDVCVKSAVQDSSGAPARDPYSVVVPQVPILVRPQRGDVEQRNAKRTQVRKATLYINVSDLPTGFTLTAKHQLRVPNIAGAVYVIESVINPNDMDHHLEVECEVQPA